MISDGYGKDLVTIIEESESKFFLEFPDGSTEWILKTRVFPLKDSLAEIQVGDTVQSIYCGDIKIQTVVAISDIFYLLSDGSWYGRYNVYPEHEKDIRRVE